jgi:hypothetical protein
MVTATMPALYHARLRASIVIRLRCSSLKTLHRNPLTIYETPACR